MTAVMRLAFTTLALPAVAAAASMDEVLAADDACHADASCAFHALQQQRWEVDVTGAAELRAPEPVAQQEALFQAMADAGVKARHLEQPRAQYEKLSAKEALAKSNATANNTCDTWTGGTCLTSGCGASRGATTCSNFRCICQKGFCSKNGVCVFNFAQAVSSYASSWGGSSPAQQPILGWGGPAAPAPAPWANSASAWASGWSAPTSGGNSFTGGSCMASNCDASRGPTECGLSTGYQCKCKSNYRAVNGICIWR